MREIYPYCEEGKGRVENGYVPSLILQFIGHQLHCPFQIELWIGVGVGVNYLLDCQLLLTVVMVVE